MEEDPILGNSRRLSARLNDGQPALTRRSVRSSEANETLVDGMEVKTPAIDKELEAKVRLQGRTDIVDSFRLFGRLFWPAIVISLWMLLVSSLFAWAIPHKLCQKLSIEASGSQFGLLNCALNTGENDMTARIFFLSFNTIQFAWIAVFPGFIAVALFGSCVTKWMRIFVAFWTSVSIVITIVTGHVVGLAYNNYYAVITASCCSLINIIIVSGAAVAHTQDRLMRWRWIGLNLFGGLVNTTYAYIIPTLITARSQDALGGFALTFVRLIVHPLIWQADFFFFRVIIRHIGHIPDLLQVTYLIWPAVYSSLYGRFLLLQLESVGSIILIDCIINAFGIASALVERAVDDGWLDFVYGRRAADVITALRSRDEMETAFLMTSMMMENGSVLAASAVLTFGRVAAIPGVRVSSTLIWRNAALQVVDTIAFQFVAMVATGKFNSFSWKSSYPRRVWRLLIFAWVMITFGGTRLYMDLLLLFCPTYYNDGRGILLEQCDKPSLFQALKFSFVSRLKDTTIGAYVNEYLAIDPVENVN